MDQLKRLRMEKGLSQAKLAALADVDPSTVNQIERGAREASPATLRKLAIALDVSIADILEDAAPKVPAPPSLFNSLEEKRLPRSREESAFVIVGWMVDEQVRMVVLWNVPPEERNRYRPTLRAMLSEGFIEDELPEGARELLAGAG